ncbi:MAG: hypothetical protein H0W65_04075 [Sphingomonas sp.]|uniref:hypothetical protein n=1 Tax=Sphingomonas sp. TaxID=28214 RepID=UPI0017ABD461|nr:hypothetical protein [Sphingomonas sp.]MBA3666883.1 hypothetical protein [Sphingomonas sp.]
MFTLLLAIAMAAPNPSSIVAPRRAFATCLKTFETMSRQGKIDAAAYSAAVKSACPSEAAALMNALVAFDVAMGNKRSSATANAARDVDDYRLTSEERYRDLVGHP